MAGVQERVDVRLVGVPLRLRARAQEHDRDLLRELALVRLGADKADTAVPQRLLSIADEVQASYGESRDGPNAEMDAAFERGGEFVDVTYTVPRDALEFIRRAKLALDAAEEYCRSGRHLLTLAAPADIAAYRRWVFGEFERQIGGEPPTPWPRAATSVGSAGREHAREVDDREVVDRRRRRDA